MGPDIIMELAITINVMDLKPVLVIPWEIIIS